jgi:hypothetical protein
MPLSLLQAEETLTTQRVENPQAIPDSPSHPLQSIRCPCKQRYLLFIRACANYPKAASALKELYLPVHRALLQAEVPSTLLSTRNSCRQSLILQVILFSSSDAPASRDIFCSSEHVPTARRQLAHSKNCARPHIQHSCKQRCHQHFKAHGRAVRKSRDSRIIFLYIACAPASRSGGDTPE